MVSETMNDEQKNAVIVSLDNNVSELMQLADTLDYVVVKIFIQERKLPDVNFFVGSGKLDEIKEFIEDSE
jgi:50S ribosomal subunit-associated GTPase HflX